MEPWGIMMTGITLFGMFALVLASVTMDGGEAGSSSASKADEPMTQAEKTVKRAA